MDKKYEKLQNIIRDYESVLVAYSGGVDSAFVLKVARDCLGRHKAKAVTAKSESLPEREFEASRELAREIGAEQIVIETREMEKAGYVENTGERCYFCKETLYEAMRPLADEQGFREIVNGTNLDDLVDFRPGLKAAAQFGVKSPLVEAGFTKADVRHYARLLGLSVADKPAAACLSSRLPYGEKVTPEKLAQIESCENYLKDLGFKVVRVRHHGDVARIELGRGEMPRFFNEKLRDQVAAAFKAFGFLHITLDLQGYRAGSLNDGWSGGGCRLDKRRSAQRGKNWDLKSSKGKFLFPP